MGFAAVASLAPLIDLAIGPRRSVQDRMGKRAQTGPIPGKGPNRSHI